MVVDEEELEDEDEEEEELPDELEEPDDPELAGAAACCFDPHATNEKIMIATSNIDNTFFIPFSFL